MYFAWNELSCVSKYVPSSASVIEVVGHEETSGCSATSKPSAVYVAAWAFVSVALG